MQKIKSNCIFIFPREKPLTGLIVVLRVLRALRLVLFKVFTSWYKEHIDGFVGLRDM